MTHNGLSIFVIYDKPSDYPNHFVVRPQIIVDGKIVFGDAELADSLEEARKLIPPGLFNLGRYEDDPKAIVECWI